MLQEIFVQHYLSNFLKQAISGMIKLLKKIATKANLTSSQKILKDKYQRQSSTMSLHFFLQFSLFIKSEWRWDLTFMDIQLWTQINQFLKRLNTKNFKRRRKNTYLSEKKWCDFALSVAGICFTINFKFVTKFLNLLL